jgi:Sec1 family
MLFATRTIPIIKYRSGFAETIVNVIQRNFYNVFEKFPELKEEFSKKNSTLLSIVDRDLDLPIMFHHSPSLGSMIHDICGISRTKSKGNVFEIDPTTDYIWNQYLGTSFVTVKEKIIEDLKNLDQKTAFLDNKNNKNQDLEKMTEQITTTLEGLKDLKLRQNCLNNHATFQEKLTKEIDSRNLGLFYSFEEGLLNCRTISKEAKKTFFDIISLKQLNVKDINLHKNDILRLAIIYYLINTNITPEEMKEIEKCLTNIGVSLDAFEYFKQKRSFEESMRKGGNSNQERSFLQKSISFLVKRIAAAEQTSIVADTINNLAANKEVKEYVAYNLLKKSVEKINNSFSQVIVFVIGGGCLSEFEYIDEFLTKNDRTVYLYN